jgi:hypothetical protein
MAEALERKEFTNEGEGTVFLFDGRPVRPGRSVQLNETAQEQNKGLIEDGVLAEAKATKRGGKTSESAGS